MKIHSDLLGMALKDYLSGNINHKLIVHSPDFEDDEIEVSWYFREYESMPALEQKALHLCYGDIIDVGAGAGSHALYLQNLGRNVSALDISPGACEVMIKRGLTSVIHGDIFDLNGKKWDTILFMMNGIGILENLDNMDWFLRRAKELLNPGGQILFDSTNLIYLFTNENGVAEIDLNREYYGQIRFQLEYKAYHSPPFDWLYIDFDTLTDMADQHGLSSELLETGENHHYLARIIS